ncbi:phage major capsid protein [Kribbella sp. NPDC050281]|uniref:phage major capsid protein n=1 Tax=Kribbella sp. NPDC050281 TaxID=3155515 RepID=UPI0033F5EA08
MREAERVRKTLTFDERYQKAMADAGEIGKVLEVAKDHLSPIDMSAQAVAKASGGPVDTTAALVQFLRTGALYESQYDPATRVSKAALVEDATGQVLIPQDLSVDILNVVREQGLLRDLADVRPTIRNKHQARLLGASAAGWTKLEVSGSAADGTPAPESPGQEIDVHDLVALVKIGLDELDDSPANVRAALVDAVSSVFVDLEDTAFAAGSGSGQPKGLALAANVARVPVANTTTAAASATPTVAQILAMPWTLPTRWRPGATWLMSEDAAKAVAGLTTAGGDLLMPEPGKGIGPGGWPLAVVPGLPSMATAGSTNPSIWFVNMKRAYRVSDRQRITIQLLSERYAEQGQVGFLARERVGGDLLRPDAASVYLL